MTAVLVTLPELKETDATGTQHYSHYVHKKYHEAYLTGEEVPALCGFKMQLTRDPEKFPICPECKYLYENVVKP